MMWTQLKPADWGSQVTDWGSQVTNVGLSEVRVLIVEDEMMVAMLLEDMLAEIGYTPVGPAVRIEPALKLVEQGGFDIAILDVNLDGHDSYPIADALAARSIPFVFASGTAQAAYGRNTGASLPFRSRFSSGNWSRYWPPPLAVGPEAEASVRPPAASAAIGRQDP
jgi:CheY-like chemotaxis protein